MSKTQQLNGYPSLSAFIVSDNDRSTFIYRRFDRLSTRNLLYLQSELAELEARQIAYDTEDVEGAMTDKQCARNWADFKSQSQDNERQRKRMILVKEIRETLEKYRKAILLEKMTLSIEKPSSRSLSAFQNVFNNLHGVKPGEPFPTLGGHSATLYDNEEDLLVLSSPEEEDRLTGFLRYYFGILFTIQRTDSPLTYFSEAKLRLTVAIINFVLAAALLFGAIYNLYWVPDNQKRLGLIAGYTVAFAACVGFATNAKRSEVFAACAAYAAVLVVFVSGNLTSPN